LIDAGLRVVLHDDHFTQDCPDEVWLAEVGRRNWIVITRDSRIRYRVVEREAVIANGVRVISLTGRNLAFDELGSTFAEAADVVERFVEHNPGPFIATMSRSGQLRLTGDRT